MKSLHLQPAAEAIAPAGPAGPDKASRVRSGGLGKAKVAVECVSLAELRTYEDAWSDLARRTIDPNVFLGPAFALPLVQHVASRRHLRFLLAWEDGGPGLFDRLLGLFPLELPRRGVTGACARGFAHEQTSCGTPLVDRVHAAEVFEAVTAWLGEQRGRPAALILKGVARDEAFLPALSAFCIETSRSMTILETWERAVLPRPSVEAGRVASFASAKRRKEWARQSRRLSESGRRTYVSARTPSEVAAAMERFLALEHSGWKGARGTSLLANPARATFTRTMARLMAEQARCRVDAIEIDGRPIAMGIILSDADRAYFWKTTFDEGYASLSPGVQLVLELTRVQQADPGVALTDSCAMANHPMIDRLWPDRAAAVDVILAVRPDRRVAFDRSVRLERWRRALRRRAKTLWLWARRKRRD